MKYYALLASLLLAAIVTATYEDDIRQAQRHAQEVRRRAHEQFELAQQLERELHERERAYAGGKHEPRHRSWSEWMGFGRRPEEHYEHPTTWIQGAKESLSSTVKPIGEYARSAMGYGERMGERLGDKAGYYAREARDTMMSGTHYVLFHPYLWGLMGLTFGVLLSLLASRKYMDLRSHRMFELQLQNRESGSISPVFCFSVMPGKEDNFVKNWSQLIDFLRGRPGFKKAHILKPLHPSNEWLGCAEWERMDDYLSATSTAEYDALSKRLKNTASVRPHLYQPLSEQSIAGRA